MILYNWVQMKLTQTTDLLAQNAKVIFLQKYGLLPKMMGEIKT
jgi:hypothetical protein